MKEEHTGLEVVGLVIYMYVPTKTTCPVGMECVQKQLDSKQK
jgi:hypothetical protein